MRICAVIASLGCGGAERVLLELCRAWMERGDNVILVTLSHGAEDHYPVPAGVTRVPLDVLGHTRGWQVVSANVTRVRALRRAIVQASPDVVVSFIDRMNVRTLLATSGLPMPVIVSERSDPREYPMGTLWSALRTLTYRHADALVMQTSSLRAWGETHLPSSCVLVIPNPVRMASNAEIDLPVHARGTEIVAMGRMADAKGFDLLIDAFAMVQPEFPAWRLRIVGDGPDRATLERQARSRLPESAVIFHGRTADPDSILAATPVFVLSSRYEGFPNVLLEALQSGCACVATDCQSGPADLITHGTNGLLVAPRSAPAIAEGLRTLLRDEAMRDAFGASASASVSRFALSGIVTQWDEAFRAAGAHP